METSDGRAPLAPREGEGEKRRSAPMRRRGSVRALLRRGSYDAVRLYIDTIADGQVKLETRLECAARILERTYGKGNPIEPRFGPEGTQKVVYSLQGELEDYAK